MVLDIIVILGITVLILDFVYILLGLYEKIIELSTVKKLNKYYEFLKCKYGDLEDEN